MKGWWKDFLEVGPGDRETEAWLDSLSKPQRLALLWLCPEVRFLRGIDADDRDDFIRGVQEFCEWCRAAGHPAESTYAYGRINPSTPNPFHRLYRALNNRWHAGG